MHAFNPLNPMVHFWLHHTVQGEVVGVTHGLLCTWQLLGLAVKEPQLAPSGPISALVAQSGLENATLTLWEFISSREGGLGSKRVFA